MMKKQYESPVLMTLAFVSSEAILSASEEAFDINVSFDTLWGIGL